MRTHMRTCLMYQNEYSLNLINHTNIPAFSQKWLTYLVKRFNHEHSSKKNDETKIYKNSNIMPSTTPRTIFSKHSALLFTQFSRKCKLIRNRSPPKKRPLRWFSTSLGSLSRASSGNLLFRVWTESSGPAVGVYF